MGVRAPRQYNPREITKTLWSTTIGPVTVLEPNNGLPLQIGHILAIDEGGETHRVIARYVVVRIIKSKQQLKLLRVASTREACLVDLADLTKGIS